jgi:serine protease Do
MPDKKPPPEVVEQHYDGRRGYANYYYNRLNRDRVWQSLAAHGDFTALGGDWSLRGELVGAGEAEFQINDTVSGCALPGGELKLPMGGSLSSASEPPTSGGLLAALFLWRRLLVKGPERFGGMEYYGTLPLAASPALAGHAGLSEQPALVDMLIGTYGGVECHYLVDPVSGHLLVMELFLRDDDDPCELRFFDYRQVEGRDVPGRMLVQYGDNLYGMFTFDEVRFAAGGLKDEG